MSSTTGKHLRAVPPVNIAPRARDGHEEDVCVRDARLVAEAEAGDAMAWARLYQDNFDRLYRDARYLVRDADSAEEVVQEAFAIALTSLDRFDRRATFAGWLRGIIHNLVRRRWRTEERRGRAYNKFQNTLDAASADGGDPEAAQVRRQRSVALSEVLTTVPEPLREVFLLRDVQGLSVQDVALRLGTTPGNVRVRATRARQRIRDGLVAMGSLRQESP